jgi:N-carbamoyl-L-amino-acid hydrolase
MVQRESMVDQVSFDAGLGLELSELLKAPVVPTGAGHDAGVLAGHVPTAMLFVRNPSGVSHAPEEYADAADCLVGIDALADVLENLVR